MKNILLQRKFIVLSRKIDLFQEESLQNLNKKKFILAVRSGTSAAAYLTKFPPKNLIILTFADNPTLIDVLLTHKANAIAQDKTLLLPGLRTNRRKFRFLNLPILQEDVALAARFQLKC